MRRRLRHLAFALLVFPASACIHAGGPPGAARAPMGDWSSWQKLDPLVEVAAAHVDTPTRDALVEASKLLGEGKAASADARLARQSRTGDRHWVAIARADLAALHFTSCIRGVAWRLEDSTEPKARTTDFSEDARVGPGDVSVEALLTNLDAAIAKAEQDDQRSMLTQGRIARVRVAAFATQCAPNEEVSARAQTVLRSDLAVLAANGHLTPDLAYIWGGIQLQEYSGAAARPFLLQAMEGGFSDPSVGDLLALIALEAGDLDEAESLAAGNVELYARVGERAREANAHYVQGEVDRRRANAREAAAHYELSLARDPTHVRSLVGLMLVDLGREIDAARGLHGRLRPLLLEGPLDEPAAAVAAANLQALVIETNELPALAQTCRDALLIDIDEEEDPARRGLRYFYAATLDVALGEFDAAQGHAATAETEFEESSLPTPDEVRVLLQRVQTMK